MSTGRLDKRGESDDVSADIVELLRRFVTEEEDTDPGDEMSDLPGMLIEPDEDNGGNGDSRVDPEFNKQEISYMGHYRTTTRIVEIMRQQGNQESADLLEELRLTKLAAKQLLDNLKDLHKRKTGTYPSLSTLRKASHREP